MIDPTRPAPARRLRADDGAALVEFTLVAGLLMLLVFGIINFGLILSFKQDVTRAAAEGARAAAVAIPSTTAGTNDPRRLAAVTATDEAVDSFGKTCGAGGLTCNVSIHDCADPIPDTNGYHSGTGNTQPDCVTVELVYDYEANPLLVPVPIISAVLPDEIRAQSVARLNE
jgi:Flp pilus assembly protein TadG